MFTSTESHDTPFAYVYDTPLMEIIRKRVSYVNPHLRRNLANEIESLLSPDSNNSSICEASGNNINEIDRITMELHQARESIITFQKRERLIDRRIRLFKKQKNMNDIEKGRNTTEEEEERLKQIEVIHKDMMIQIESMRQKIKKLEEKQEALVEKTEECHEFVRAVKWVEEEEMMAKNECENSDEEQGLDDDTATIKTEADQETV